jgi:hypothetical protein
LSFRTPTNGECLRLCRYHHCGKQEQPPPNPAPEFSTARCSLPPRLWERAPVCGRRPGCGPDGRAPLDGPPLERRVRNAQHRATELFFPTAVHIFFRARCSIASEQLSMPPFGSFRGGGRSGARGGGRGRGRGGGGGGSRNQHSRGGHGGHRSMSRGRRGPAGAGASGPKLPPAMWDELRAAAGSRPTGAAAAVGIGRKAARKAERADKRAAKAAHFHTRRGAGGDGLDVDSDIEMDGAGRAVGAPSRERRRRRLR